MKHEYGFPFIGKEYYYEHYQDDVSYRRIGILGVGLVLLMTVGWGL